MEQKRVRAIEELSYRIAKQVQRSSGDASAKCPTCGHDLMMEHQAFCVDCGQKLAWEDEPQ